MVLWILRRTSDDDHPTKAILTGSLTADFLTEVPIATIELGNASSGMSYATDTWTIPEPVKFIRFTPIDCAGPNYGFRKFWHAAEINLYHPANFAVTNNMMMDLLNTYDAYLWGESFNIGTNPGQYTDQASADAFLAILQTIDQIMKEEIERPSDVEIKAMIQQAKDYYAAYLTSLVEYTLPGDGYYRIIANLDYYTTVETGEVDENGNPVTERVYGVKKSMYSMLEGFGAWHTLDLTDCRDVWHISRNGDNTVNIINAATEMGFSQFGNPVYMSTDPAAIQFMRFEWVGNENGQDILYLKGYGQTDVMHQLSHQRGAGTGDKLCTWSGTFNMGLPYESDKGTSEWYLEPVSNEEAQALIEAYAVVKDHDKMVMEYRNIQNQAKQDMLLANNAYKEAFITRNDQFSSSVTESSEGSLNNLLDDNAETFWHSAWSGEKAGTIGGTHFLDVTLDEPIEGTVYAWIQRRAGAENDHPISWNVYGSNDEAALQSEADFTSADNSTWREETIAGWTLVAEGLSTPYDVNISEVTTPEFNIPTPYKYLRFVCEESTGASYGTRGFFHMGGFQIFKTLGKTQLETMGEVGTTMIAEIEKGDAITDEAITLDDFNALKAAYEAFKALLKDPTTMRNTVAKYMTYADMLVIGTEPGFWASDAEAVALKTLITAANDYDKGGAYDQTKLDDYTSAIEAAAATFINAANKVSTDKWYRLRFPTEETYTKYGWSDGNILPDEGYIYGNLWGQYAAIATYTDDEEYKGLITVKETEEMREGDGLRFTELDNISNEDAALFRFVNIGDSAYIIQNKATGLYINCLEANSNDVTMSLTPTTFQANAVGYGSMLLAGKSLDGTSVTNLHAQRRDHRLVTWESAEPGSNSGLWLETADVTGDAANLFYRDYAPGVFNVVCDAIGVKAEEDGDINFYTVEGTYTEGETSFVALKKITETQPGVPYIAIVGTPEDYVEGEEDYSEPYPFTALEGNFAPKAGVAGGLIGTYTALTAPTGSVVFVNNAAETAEDKVVDDGNGNYVSVTNRAVAAGSGYLSFGYADADPSVGYDMLLAIDGTPTVTTEIEKHEGTKEDPYLILTPKDMSLLRGLLIPGRVNYVQLGADIDMAGIKNWYPLNMVEDQANGYEYQNLIDFDGHGYVISNFTDNDATDSYNSFFGILNGDVRNVGFKDVDVSCAASGTGVLAGYMGHDQYVNAEGVKQTSTLTNVWVSGKLNVVDNYAGGLIGNIGGPSVFKNVYVNVDITGNADYVGGLVGRIRDGLTIENAYAAGTLSSKGCGIVGGGQKDITAPSIYKNIVVWNNTDQNFGPLRQGVDQAEGISYFDGTNFAALQQVIVDWGKPWTCDMQEGSYPTFSGTDTGIQGVTSAQPNAKGTIYTINGIRVEKTTKGLYIIDGKKVMVK